MSEERLDTIISSLGRVEGTVTAIQKDIATTTTRLNDHAESIKSLKATRDKIRGAGKLGLFCMAVSGVVLGWVRWYG